MRKKATKRQTINGSLAELKEFDKAFRKPKPGATTKELTAAALKRRIVDLTDAIQIADFGRSRAEQIMEGVTQRCIELDERCIALAERCNTMVAEVAQLTETRESLSLARQCIETLEACAQDTVHTILDLQRQLRRSRREADGLHALAESENSFSPRLFQGIGAARPT